MSDANKALAEVRGWLCDNLGSGDAGKVCGMLSVVSRRINEIEDENAKLRIIVCNWYPHMVKRVGIDAMTQWGYMDVLRELGIEVTENE